MFLEECKYVVKEKKIPKYIIDNIGISSDSDRGNSDEQNSDKETSDKKKGWMKKVKKYFFKNDKQLL